MTDNTGTRLVAHRPRSPSPAYCLFFYFHFRKRWWFECDVCLCVTDWLYESMARETLSRCVQCACVVLAVLGAARPDHSDVTIESLQWASTLLYMRLHSAILIQWHLTSLQQSRCVLITNLYIIFYKSWNVGACLDITCFNRTIFSSNISGCWSWSF